MGRALVESWVKRLNSAWTSGHFDAMQELFHPDVCTLTPEGHSIVGCAALVESYKQFLETATLHRFDLTSIEIELFSTTAVTRASFWIDYEMQGERRDETGVDLWVLEPDNAGQWLGVWCTQLPVTRPLKPTLTECRCPACQRIILNRRLADCEFCGEALPAELRLSEAEKAERREWELKRLRKLQRDEHQTRFGPQLGSED